MTDKEKIAIQIFKKSCKVSFFFIVFIFFACSKELSSNGLSSFGGNDFYLQDDSSIKVFSYFHKYPEFLTQLSRAGDSVNVPRNLLLPKMNFGVPENELIYANRTNPSKPVPIDLFLKIYSPSSSGKDFYYEIPIVGENLKPTNTTTALSWILRWSFGTNVVSLSKNNFDEIINQVELTCNDCRQKTNTELVDLILSTSHLKISIVNKVRADNSSLQIGEINYQPVPLDYAWSEPTVGANWTISTSIKEPELNTLTRIFSVSQLQLDALLVQPLRSSSKIKPSSWKHEALLEDTPAQTPTYKTMPEVPNTPFQYRFDEFSSGLHIFTSRYTNPETTPLTVKATVLNEDMLPSCVTNSGLGRPVSVRANTMFKLKIDNTIMPTVTTTQVDPSLRLTTSEVSFTRINSIPTDLSRPHYRINFQVVGGQTSLNFEILSNPGNTVITSSANQPYLTGTAIRFQNFSLFVSGVPVNGDRIDFYLPYDPSAADSGFYDQDVRCIDPDLSTQTNLRFSKVSGPEGLTVAPNGTVTWYTRLSDVVTAPTPNPQFRFLVSDVSGKSQEFDVEIQVLGDRLPVLCLTNPGVGGLCPNPGLTQTPALEMNTGPGTDSIREGINIMKDIFVTDNDGDPVTITIEPVQTNTVGYFNLDPLSNLSYAILDRRSNADPAISQYLWKFRPSFNLISGESRGKVKGLIKIQYDTARDPNLTPGIIRTIPVELDIINELDSPARLVSTTESCSISGVAFANCPAAQPNGATWIPKYYVYVGDSTTTNPTPLTDIKTNTPVANSPAAANSILQKGVINTIVIPSTARLAPTKNPTTGLLEGGNTKPLFPFLYSIAGTCPFATEGFSKVEEVKCNPLAASADLDCLKLYLNYNPVTGLQDPFPYKLLPRCRLTVTAHDPKRPEASTQLFTGELTIQDRNQMPVDRSGGGGTISYPSHLLFKPNSLPQQGSPLIEGQTVDLMELVRSFYGDSDLGAQNGLNNNSILIPQAPNDILTSGKSVVVIQKFNRNDFNSNLRFNPPASIPAGGGLYLQHSTTGNGADDPTSSDWQDIPDNLFQITNNGFFFKVSTALAGAAFNLSLEQQSTGVYGSVTETDWVPYTGRILRIDANNNFADVTSNLNSEGLYYVIPVRKPPPNADFIFPFRARITSNPTTTVIRGQIISDYQMDFSSDGTGVGNNPGELVRYEPRVADQTNLSIAPLSMGLLTTNQISGQTAPQQGLSRRFTYFLRTDPTRPYIRSVLKMPSTNPLPPGQNISQFGIIVNSPVDAVENFNLSCYLFNGVSYLNCNTAKDSNGLVIFPTAFTNRALAVTQQSTIPWSIPYEFAHSSNLQSAMTTPTNTSYSIILRVTDKGFYGSNLNLDPVGTTCQNALDANQLSCIQKTIDFKVMDNGSMPIIEIYDGTNTNVVPRKRWKQPAGGVGQGAPPVIEVDEESLKTITMIIKTYSNNTADLVKYDLRNANCSTSGPTCFTRTSGTGSLLSLNSAASSSSSLGGDFKDGPSSHKFVFDVKPNAVEGNGPNGQAEKTYTYSYTLTEICDPTKTNNNSTECRSPSAGATGKTMPFSFTIKVNNINHAPTDIEKASIQDPTPGLTYERCGDPLVSSCDFVDFKYTIDMNRAGGTKGFYIPLHVKDSDKLVGGIDGVSGPSADNLIISAASTSGFNNPSTISVNTAKVNQESYSFLWIDLSKSGCIGKSTGTNQDVIITLTGSDQKSAAKVTKPLNLTIKGITNPGNCL